MEVAADVLMRGLPSGMKLVQMSWAGISWDKTTGMFLRRGQAGYKAVFLAEDQGESPALLNFILKGTMKT
jgi:hypothetical protein